MTEGKHYPITGPRTFIPYSACKSSPRDQGYVFLLKGQWPKESHVYFWVSVVVSPYRFLVPDAVGGTRSQLEDD